MFNLREFQNETQYNQMKDSMPIPNVVHIVSPDTMYYNTVKQSVWKDGLSLGKFISFSFYDNTLGLDSNMACYLYFKLIDTSGVEHDNFSMSIKYENNKRIVIGLPSSTNGEIILNNTASSFYYVEKYFTKENDWYTLKDWNTFWDMLFRQSGAYNNYNWTPAYGIITGWQYNVVRNHFKLLVPQD